MITLKNQEKNTGTKNMLPPIICGPILRCLNHRKLVLWWVSPHRFNGKFECFIDPFNQPMLSCELKKNTEVIQIGKHAFVHLFVLKPETNLPEEQKIEYDLILYTNKIDDANPQKISLAQLFPNILYNGETRPSFVVKMKLNKLLHGSCRHPHHNSDDSFIGADREIGETLNNITERPALLMLTGDQIYADHVAGPLLQAIHQIIELLGLYEETFIDAPVKNSNELYNDNNCYYRRDKILPKTTLGNRWYNKGGLHPIFTSFFSSNHVITFAEVMAMYLLVWSPALWQFVKFRKSLVADEFRDSFEKEQSAINQFVVALPVAQRLFAHIPSYMIFDDHDVTDDWNLTAQWEEAAYKNMFSKRIIGNTLLGYWLCQGWGNAPEKFDLAFMEKAHHYFDNPSLETHDAFIEVLFNYKKWHYELPTSPKLVVVNSRTERWHSEKNPASPSGLMTWESMMELQQTLIGEKAVILVAPAPIFGVKLIETIQGIFTFFGYPLAVDSENWMAHSGCAYTLLQIFKHLKTPTNVVILSGDVHYSFVYDIIIRFRDNNPHIWQITSSGIKNEFPGKPLRLLDRLNRWMYAPYSPLNLLTKRKDMIIHQRIPTNKGKDRLINTSGIGLVQLDDNGVPLKISELYANEEPMEFIKKIS